MVATRLDILVEQAATTQIIAEVLDADGINPRDDLTGWTGAMQIRPTQSSDTVLATADVTVDGTTAQVTATIADYLTSAMAWHSGVYDLIITDGEQTERLLYGVARFRPSTTRGATPVTVVNSINGQHGDVTLSAANVGAIATTVVTTKGDLIVGTGAGVVTRLAVAANGRVLTADDTAPEGVSWQPPASTINLRGAWAASTVYAVGDLVTLGGELLYCTTAHTSASAFALTNWTDLTSKPGRYNVKLYGAKGDGSTDDTTAIKAAIAAGFAAGTADGTSYAEIFFPVGEYVISGALTQGGTTQGNAQIPLPVVASTDEKFILTFLGAVEDSTGFVHWEQTVAQKSGVVLRSTLTGLALDPTWGAPSVIGGPTVSQGSGVYSNMKVVIKGVTVMAPYNPGIIGVDLRYCAQAHVISLACLANAPAVGSPAITTRPTNDLGMGLRVPQNGNNDCALVDDYSCEGFYYGISAGEHLSGSRIAIVYGRVGIFWSVGGGSFHGGSILNLSVEAVDTALQTVGSSGGSWPVFIGQLAVESVTTTVDDPNGNLTGIIYFTDILNAGPVVNGAANVKILCVSQKGYPGTKTAPSVPASTVPLTNPFWRDCVVVISGGTVSAIAVDGVATGYTTTGHTVIVPSGKTITLTYSSAPTWTWTAL